MKIAHFETAPGSGILIQTMAERAAPRYPTQALVEIEAEGEAARGKTKNLSKGGLCATVANPLPLGREVPITLTLLADDDEPTTEPLAVRARIVWCTAIEDHHQVGLAFVGLNEAQRLSLKGMLELLDGAA